MNTASVNGVRPGMFQGIYSATKAAIINMTLAFARECAPYKIRCNAVVPGLTDTRFASALTQNQQILDAFLPQIPLRRIAQPDEIAPAILFLASDASSYVTGTCIVADGGYLRSVRVTTSLESGAGRPTRGARGWTMSSRRIVDPLSQLSHVPRRMTRLSARVLGDHVRTAMSPGQTSGTGRSSSCNCSKRRLAQASPSRRARFSKSDMTTTYSAESGPNLSRTGLIRPSVPSTPPPGPPGGWGPSNQRGSLLRSWANAAIFANKPGSMSKRSA